MSEVWFVFLAALATALATGLGALPFAVYRKQGTRVLGAANALAAGVMLGAGVSLIVEGSSRSVLKTAVGAVAGAAFVYGTKRLLERVRAPSVAELSGADARKGVLIVTVMTAHSASEGIAVGSSFGGGEALGIVIALAIAIHNIPEGLAISLVLVPRGASVVSAAGWSIFSSLPQPILAVPAFLFVEQFGTLLPAALGFAGGAMIWMLAHELLPDAVEQAPRREVAGIVAAGFAAMFAFQYLLTP